MPAFSTPICRVLTAALLVPVLLVVAPSLASAATCPCSVFGPFDTPTIPAADDPASVEVGMRWRADDAGFVKGVRFYQGIGNTGTHTGTLWTNAGMQLATATFTGESGMGWQQVLFDAPVAVDANTTYVVSYHAPQGRYSATIGGLTNAVDAAPLHALANGVDGANGVYSYSPTTTFPTSSFGAANYWVDVVWDTTSQDTMPPSVTSTVPAPGSTTGSKRANVVASFSEPLDPASVSAATVELRTAGGALVPATISYDAPKRAIVIDPAGSLAATSSFTATISGGATGAVVRDVAGNALPATHTWTFTTVGLEPQDGPGGPILVVTDSDHPYSSYYAEILRAEGLNLFATADVDDLSASVLAEHEVVLLGEVPVSAAQVTALTTWVDGGGNLVLMRPDDKLAPLAGLTTSGSTLANAYLKVDTSAAPGTGIVGSTMQFHGVADRYALGDATAAATLFADATTATTNPALTMRTVGTAGGQVATFTYDLARSVVLTRQGNPAWVGQDRDGIAPARSNDLFFGGAAGDPQPDWVNLDKVAVPQADEQQRLLANVITELTADAAPMPRFWYLPDGRKAAVVHALDDHNTENGTKGTIAHWKAESPSGCSVEAWECYRATSWMYRNVPVTDAEAAVFRSEGFDLGIHINTGCGNFTSEAVLESQFAGELAAFQAQYPSLPAQRGNRTHCIPWSDWSSLPAASLANGIRIDMGYYYWPGSWVQDRPGFFTGSGMPMRYADTAGSMIDVYQLANQLVNENQQSYPAATNALLDRALGAEGYYAVLGTHDDYSGGSAFSEGILASAKSRGVAVVSADQMLTWLDGRNAAAMRSVTWDGGTLSFAVTRSDDARGLTGMVPIESSAGTLQQLTRNGTAVTTKTETIKGVDYAMYSASVGSYEASYLPYTVLGDAVPQIVEDDDPAAVELGMRFRSDVAGTVTGVRFYKGVNNTGPHVGSLWTTSGTRLASVEFDSETASGWQRAAFSTPVAIQPNVTYVVSYHAPNGRYSTTPGVFTSAVNSAPLHAPADVATAHNGVYSYGETSTFPTQSWQSASYLVDVTFNAAPADDTPPAEPSCPCNVFPANSMPGDASADDTDAVEVGMRVRSDAAGSITGVRFYKGAGNTGTHVGNLWTADGTLLATATFANETATGWQQASFPSPVAIEADTDYVVSYFAPEGRYAADAQYFATSGVDAAPLRAPMSTTSAPNGLFRYGSTSAFPDHTWNAANYWVDVVYVGANADLTAPTVTSTSPVDEAVDVPRTSNVTATFSEALAAATVNATSLRVVARGETEPVAAAVTWNAGTMVATLDPTAPLAAATTYDVTLASSVTDVAGNALAANVTWSFTTAQPAPAVSLFPDTSAPVNASATDTLAVEVGMRFRSDVAGTVTAIRFYKGAGNTGTHVGNLWTNTGTLLGSATFTDETATGWQQATLATPVAITAGTTYVVSYHAPAGGYAADHLGFSGVVDAAPLHGLANGIDGGNGVFSYGPAGTFPTGSWQSSNYWVDLAFVAD